MDKKCSEAFISEVDNVLAAIGFKFVKSRNIWERKVSKTDVEWFHLNFGLTVLNPSFGVKYKDIEKLLPKDAGGVHSTACMLSRVTGESYSDSTDPRVFAKSVCQLLPIQLERMRDREWVVECLKCEDVKTWPVFGLSMRIRLLPLILAKNFTSKEAIEYLDYFERMFGHDDQMIPNYSLFKGSLMKHLSA